jgi:serine/threonine protein kinase
VKVLDFGLAKIDKAKRSLPDSEETLTHMLTQESSIVGTLPYMAPEQLQGQAIDTRADIFSFGCVLYEMLTVKRAFAGANAVSLTAAIP